MNSIGVERGKIMHLIWQHLRELIDWFKGLL